MSDSAFSRWLLLASGLWCVCWFIHGLHDWEDDAYIHLEFARNLAAGHGYSFNGLLVNGDTSPLWVLLLGAVHTLVPNWMIAGKLLAVLGVVFALTGTYFFAKRLTSDVEGNKTFAAAMVLLLAANPYFCYWSFSGMETLMALGVAFWATLAATWEVPSWGSFLGGCFLAGIAPVLRPEMLALTGLLCLLLLRQWLRLPGDALSRGKMLGLLAGIALAAAPLGLWSIYALHAFGHIVPNTNAAKRAAPGEPVGSRLLYVYGLGFPLVLAEVAGLTVFAAVRPAKFGRMFRKEGISAGSWIFAIWVLAAAIFYLADHTWVQTRYIFVMAPGLMFAMLAFNYRQLPRWAYRASFSGAFVAALAVSAVTTWPLVRNKGIQTQQLEKLCTFVRNDLPPDAPLAIYSIGEVAFESQHPLIDIGGITRPGVLPYMNGDLPNGVQKWAQTQGAEYFDSGAQPEPGAVLVYSIAFPNIGWSLDPKYYAGTDVARIWRLP